MTLPDVISLSTLAGHPLVAKLGWVLLHFLWEGALGAGALALVLAGMRRRPPTERYAVSLGALAVMAALPVLTWWALPPVSPAASEAVSEAASGARVVTHPAAPARPGVVEALSARRPPVTSQEAVPEDGGPVATLARWTRRHAGRSAPLVALGWLVGVAMLAVRAIGGWAYARRMKREATPPEAERWRWRFRRLARETGLAGARRVPALLISARVEGPAAVGWWRPAVLVPTGFLTGLPPAQVEAILRHELAHIRRYDYLAGLGQTVVETLLFYHPAVWWVSGRVRTLREHCCDDCAARAAGSGLAYARALATLADWRSAVPLAPAASGGSLLARIRRVTGQAPEQRSPVGWPAAAAALVALGVLGACATGRVAGQETSEEGPAPRGQKRARAAGGAPDSSRPARPARSATPPAPAPPGAAPLGAAPRPRAYVVSGDSVDVDTLRVGVSFPGVSFPGGVAVWDSTGARQVAPLRNRFASGHPPFDSLTIFSLRRADSSLTRADSVLSRLGARLGARLGRMSGRFDSLGARFSNPDVWDSLRTRFKHFDLDSLRGAVSFGADSLRSFVAKIRGGDGRILDADSLPAFDLRIGTLPDTIFTGRAAARHALKQTADRLDARADTLAAGDHAEAARALREEADRLRERAGQQREHAEEDRVRELQERAEEARQRRREARQRRREARQRRREQRQEGASEVHVHSPSESRSQTATRLNKERREEIRSARFYLKDPVVRIDGREVFSLSRLSVRGDETLALYHPKYGLFIFSDHPFEDARRAGKFEGRTAHFTIDGRDLRVQSKAARPLTHGGRAAVYAYHDAGYEPATWQDRPWVGADQTPDAPDDGARASRAGGEEM